MSESLKFLPASHWSLMASRFVIALKKIGGQIVGNEVSPELHHNLMQYCALLELGVRNIPGPQQFRATHEFLRAWGILSELRRFETRQAVSEFLAPLIDFIRHSKEPRALSSKELEVIALLQDYFTKLGQCEEAAHTKQS